MLEIIPLAWMMGHDWAHKCHPRGAGPYYLEQISLRVLGLQEMFLMITLPPVHSHSPSILTATDPGETYSPACMICLHRDDQERP